MKKKTILTRISALVCALVMLFTSNSVFLASDIHITYGENGCYNSYANREWTLETNSSRLASKVDYSMDDITLPSFVTDGTYPYYLIKHYKYSETEYIEIYVSDEKDILLRCMAEIIAVEGNNDILWTTVSSNNVDGCYKSTDKGKTWTQQTDTSISLHSVRVDGSEFVNSENMFGGNCNLVCECGKHYYTLDGDDISLGSGGSAPDVEYDGTIGYLQDLRHSITYARGVLYNYNEKSRTDRWSFDNITTSGLDLSSGDYSVNYYIRTNLVKGYEDSDIIEKGEKYFIGNYDADVGYIQYLYEDMMENLYSQGYEDIGFIDAYLLGRFRLSWYYFEIIDNTTGASGGYICVKPKDADPNNHGVEYEVLPVDDDDVPIDGYEPDISYPGEGTYVPSEGETIEDAIDDAENDSENQENQISN